jgi:hypothetical protein
MTRSLPARRTSHRIIAPSICRNSGQTKKAIAANVGAKAVYVAFKNQSTGRLSEASLSLRCVVAGMSALCSRSRFEAVESVEKVLDVRGKFFARDIFCRPSK